METKSLLQDIDNYLLDNTVNNSLFNLFDDIKTYLTENSIPVELPVKPACEFTDKQLEIISKAVDTWLREDTFINEFSHCIDKKDNSKTLGERLAELSKSV